MKTALNKLNTAVEKFSDSISNFPVGAVSIDDFKPIEQRIETTRESLKQLDTQLLLFKTKYRSQLDEGDTVGEEEDVVFKNMEDATMQSILSDKVIKMCLHSNAIKKILYDAESDSNMQEKICSYMRKLVVHNDNVMSLQQDITNASLEQLNLKIQCQNALYEYKNFLKKQEDERAENLEGITPGLSKAKQKVQAAVKKVNIMKRLITTFIASSGMLLMSNEVLLPMLEKHRKLLNLEQLTKIKEQQTMSDTQE